MEVLFMTLWFYAIVLLATGLAVALIVRALRADRIFLAHVENLESETAEPLAPVVEGEQHLPRAA